MFGRSSRPDIRAYSPETHNRKNKLRALTGGGRRVTGAEGERIRHTKQPWQNRAWALYDELGVIKNASLFYSRPLSKVRLFAAEIDEKGELVPTQDAKVKEQVARIADPGGGTSQLLYDYGRLAFLVGEGLLLCSRDKESDAEQWEFLSTDELRIEPGAGTANSPTRYLRLRAPSIGQEEMREPRADDFEAIEADEAVVYRIWRRHPRYSHLPDSPVRGVLDVADELLLLTRSIRATARSRIANRGILLIPDGVASAPLEPGPDEDPQEDPVLADLIEAMTSAIMDESSASALAPLMLRGTTEGLKEVRHLALVEPTMLYPEIGVRAELIHRLALELDMPPEALLGVRESNHWNAWKVDEQAWKDHQEPVCKGLCNDLTAAFLHPTLRDQGVQNWEKYRIGYDAADVVVNPDRSKDAKDLYDRAAVGPKTLRDAAGFTDDDAPSEEEALRQIGLATNDGTLAATGEPAANPVPAPPAEDVQPKGQVDVVQGPPPQDGKQERAVRAARIMGAAEMALRRSREKAGARLLTLARREPKLEETLAGVATTQVAFKMGPEAAGRLTKQDARELVAGAGALLVETLREQGIDDAEHLGEQVERHAARTLFEERPPPLPPALANYVLELQS